MDLALFWLFFVILGIAYFVIAFIASAHITTNEDFFFANKKVGVFRLSATLIATHVGGGLIIGSAQEVYKFGYMGIAYSLGICASLFILSLGFAHRLRSLGLHTTAEIFYKVYGSRSLQKCASIISIITLLGLLISQIIATRKLFDEYIQGYNWVLIFFWMLVIIYTMFGGLRAVMATDVFQLAVLIIILAIASIVIFLSDEVVFVLPKSYHELKHALIGATDFNANAFRYAFFMPFFYAFFAQDLAQRFFAAKTLKTASISAFIASIVIGLFALFPLFMGMQARLQGLAFSGEQSIILHMMHAFALPVFSHLLIVGLIAAIISTADSILCAISSNIIKDFFYNDINTPYVPIFVSRFVTFMLGLIAITLGFNLNDIIKVLTISYEFSIAVLFVPIFLGYFINRLKKEPPMFAMAFGLCGFFIARFLSLDFLRGVFAILVSLIGFLIGVFIQIKFKKT